MPSFLVQPQQTSTLSLQQHEITATWSEGRPSEVCQSTGSHGSYSLLNTNILPDREMDPNTYSLSLSLSPEDMLIDFRERGREGEKYQSVTSCIHPNQGLNLHLGMYPDWESNM